MHRVIKSFEDLQDNRHRYNVDDIYPRDGQEVNHSRIKELSTSKNKRGIPLIAEVEGMPPELEPLFESDSTSKYFDTEDDQKPASKQKPKK